MKSNMTCRKCKRPLKLTRTMHKRHNDGNHTTYFNWKCPNPNCKIQASSKVTE